jgi:hypothetical protein
MLVLWWAKWHRGRILSEYFCLSLSPIHQCPTFVYTLLLQERQISEHWEHSKMQGFFFRISWTDGQKSTFIVLRIWNGLLRRIFVDLSRRRPEPDRGPPHVRFVVENVAFVQVLRRVFSFFFASVPYPFDRHRVCRNPTTDTLNNRGGSVGWSNALQAERSRVLFPTRLSRFFIDLILPVALWPWGGLSH